MMLENGNDGKEDEEEEAPEIDPSETLDQFLKDSTPKADNAVSSGDKGKDEDGEGGEQASGTDGSGNAAVPALASTTVVSRNGSITVSNTKQPKNVECPTPLPSPVTSGIWMAKLAKNLVASSIYSDANEFEWIQEVMRKTFDELADSGGERFQKID